MINKILREINRMVRRIGYVLVGFGVGANNVPAGLVGIILIVMTITFREIIPKSDKKR